MEMPRTRTANAIKRRIVSAMFAGFLAHAIAAVCEPIATEPWDLRFIVRTSVLTINLRKIGNPNQLLVERAIILIFG